MPPTGLEPATLGLKVRCSSRLSYEGFLKTKFNKTKNSLFYILSFKHKLNHF